MQIHKALVPLLALGVLFGCGGGSSNKSVTPAPATVNVYLGADSIPGFNSVMVGVDFLEWSADGVNYARVGTVQTGYDLAVLQNGNGFTPTGLMLKGVAFPPTTITSFRINWLTTGANPSNYAQPISIVKLNDGNATACPLTMPKTTVVPASIPVNSGATVNIEIMLAGNQAVQNTGLQTTNKVPSTIYTFQNVTGQGVDLAQTCTFTGKLNSTVTATVLPLGNQEVYAETSVNNTPVIVRRVLTDGEGNFALDALPVGTTAVPAIYYLVAQPYGAVVYQAQTSAPLTAVAGANTVLALNCPATLPSGTLNLTVTPFSAANQGTWAELSQSLPAPAGQSSVFANLITRSLTAVSTTTVDQIDFASVPSSIPMTLTVKRSTALAAPVQPASGPIQVQIPDFGVFPATAVFK